MDNSPIAIAKLIQEEAESVLAGQKLLPTLSEYGEVLVHGSYRYDLMTWRDLDVFLSPSEITLSLHFEIGERIARLLNPSEMFFVDSIHNEDTPVTGLDCMYWGMDFWARNCKAWKLDICLVSKEALDDRKATCDRVESQLTPETRCLILSIKTDLRTHPNYVRHLWHTSPAQTRDSSVLAFYSADIYTAVLEKGVKTAAGFLDFMKNQQN